MPSLKRIGTPRSSLFADEGYVLDVLYGNRYHGREIGTSVDVYATAHPDFHRDLSKFYVANDVVVVELELDASVAHCCCARLASGARPAK